MLTIQEIKQFIDDDILSEKKRFADVGRRYYEAEHDILNYRLFYYNSDGKLVEDTTRSNVKICHPFFTELTDQLSAYMLSFKENPIRAKDSAEGLQEQLDHYFDDDMSLREIYETYFHPSVIDLEDNRIWDSLFQGNTIDVFQFNSEVGLQAAKSIHPINPIQMTMANALMRLMGEKGK